MMMMMASLELALFICLFVACQAAPLPNYNGFSLELRPILSGHAIILISAGFLIVCGLLVFGCACCVRKDIQNLSAQSQHGLVQLNESQHSTGQTGSEFAIFPPCSSVINLQPVSLFENEAEKVIFEPLPDILPKRHINGQSFAQSSKPAHFSALLRKKSSLHDWFDDPSSNFPRNQLQYLNEIGNGWFGRVIEGDAQLIVDGQEKTPVIVKILREEATPSEHLYFLHDVRPYRDLQHPNVVRLLGRCLETDPFLLIMEHTKINLKSHLISKQENAPKQDFATSQQLVQIACDITAGLSHMHEYNFTHSDLAAHNCFLGMNNVTKIGDYGLSFDLFQEDYYCIGDVALPIRWLAPDALNCSDRVIETRDTTRESNVWSLGVVLWEIMELGKLPYEDLTNEEVLQKVILERNMYLPEPSLSHPYRGQMHQIMELCWRPTSSRPEVSVIEMLLRQLYRYKESSESFTLFEQKWNALQSKASSSSNRVPMKFENDFVSSSYAVNPVNVFTESTSDGSCCEQFQESTESVRSPSLRGLNGSFDELQIEDLDVLSSIHEKSMNSGHDHEVVTPEQITEAIRDFDAMLATEARILGVDSRSGTLERPKRGRSDSDGSSNGAEWNILNDATFVKAPGLSEIGEESCGDFEKLVPVVSDGGSSAPVSGLLHPSDFDVDKVFVSDEFDNILKPLPDILISEPFDQTCIDEIDEPDCYCPVVNVKRNYHFVFKDDVDTTKSEMCNADISEMFDYEQDDTKSSSSGPVTSTPSKASEFHSVLNDSEKLKEIATDSNDSNKSGFKTSSSSMDNSLSYNTAPLVIDSNNDDMSVASALRHPVVSEENVTSLSDNTFVSAMSNLKSDDVPKEHSHSEDYFSTLENSPVSEKTISLGIDNRNCESPDLSATSDFIVAENNKTCIINENDFAIINDTDFNANSTEVNILGNFNDDPDIFDIKFDEKLALDAEARHSQHHNSLEDINLTAEEKSFLQNLPYKLYSNLDHMKDFYEDDDCSAIPTKHYSAWSDVKDELVGSSDDSDKGSPDKRKLASFAPNTSPQNNTQDCSSVVSNSFVFLNTTNDGQSVDHDVSEDRFNRVLAWNDHSKVILSDLSDIDEGESENSTPSSIRNDRRVQNGQAYDEYSDGYDCDEEAIIQNHQEMDSEDYKEDEDDVLKIDIETNEAILVDNSESLIGFVPSRSIELLQEFDCLASQLGTVQSLHNSIDDDIEEVIEPCCNGNVAESETANISSYSADNGLSSDDGLDDSEGYKLDESPRDHRESSYLNESIKSDVSQSTISESISEMEQFLFSQNKPQNNDVNANVDIYNDVIPSNQPTKSIIWHSDETLDVLEDDDRNIGSIIIESEEILAGYQNKDESLSGKLTSDLTCNIEFGSSDFLDRLAVSASPSSNCSVSSTPCRDVYTPDFESESQESSSSCSSTSGSFECIHNKFKHVNDIALESAKKEDSPMIQDDQEESPMKVFSKTWDCHATPNKGLLKSPEKKIVPIRKSVSFHEDPQLVFQYPPASDSSEEEEVKDPIFMRQVDFTSYADWELHGSDDEIPEEMFEIEELEYEPYNRYGYRGNTVSPYTGASIYTITTFSDRDLDGSEHRSSSEFSAVSLSDDDNANLISKSNVIIEHPDEEEEYENSNSSSMSEDMNISVKAVEYLPTVIEEDSEQIVSDVAGTSDSSISDDIKNLPIQNTKSDPSSNELNELASVSGNEIDSESITIGNTENKNQILKTESRNPIMLPDLLSHENVFKSDKPLHPVALNIDAKEYLAGYCDETSSTKVELQDSQTLENSKVCDVPPSSSTLLSNFASSKVEAKESVFEPYICEEGDISYTKKETCENLPSAQGDIIVNDLLENIPVADDYMLKSAILASEECSESQKDLFPRGTLKISSETLNFRDVLGEITEKSASLIYSDSKSLLVNDFIGVNCGEPVENVQNFGNQSTKDTYKPDVIGSAMLSNSGSDCLELKESSLTSTSVQGVLVSNKVCDVLSEVPLSVSQDYLPRTDTGTLLEKTESNILIALNTYDVDTSTVKHDLLLSRNVEKSENLLEGAVEKDCDKSDCLIRNVDRDDLNVLQSEESSILLVTEKCSVDVVENRNDDVVEKQNDDVGNFLLDSDNDFKQRLEVSSGRAVPLSVCSSVQNYNKDSIVPSIVITGTDDFSSDEELKEFLKEHLKFYNPDNSKDEEAFEVTADFSEKPFEDGYSSNLRNSVEKTPAVTEESNLSEVKEAVSSLNDF